MDLWPEDLPPPPEVLRERASAAAGLLSLLTDRIDAVVLDAARWLRVVSNMATRIETRTSELEGQVR